MPNFEQPQKEISVTPKRENLRKKRERIAAEKKAELDRQSAEEETQNIDRKGFNESIIGGKNFLDEIGDLVENLSEPDNEEDAKPVRCSPLIEKMKVNKKIPSMEAQYLQRNRFLLQREKFAEKMLNNEIIQKYLFKDTENNPVVIKKPLVGKGSDELKKIGVDVVVLDKNNDSPILAIGIDKIDLDEKEEVLEKKVIEDTQEYIEKSLRLNSIPLIKFRIPVDLQEKLRKKTNKENLFEFLDFIKEDMKMQLATYLLMTLEEEIEGNKQEVVDDYDKNKKEYFTEELMSADSDFEKVCNEIKQYTDKLNIKNNVLDNVYSAIDKLRLTERKNPPGGPAGKQYFSYYNLVL